MNVPLAARSVGIAAAVTALVLFVAPTASAEPDDVTVDIVGEDNAVVMGVRYDAPGAVVCIMAVVPEDGTVAVATVGPTIVMDGDDVDLKAAVEPGDYTVQWSCSSVPAFEQWGTTPPMTTGTATPVAVTVTGTPGSGGSGNPFGS
ncbi:hypothetical protein R4282_29700 [Rhodococcus oxybenzonivorans]|uniref:hypothetical protein n=1 Tax=Rhodococcus oxybenzonivorans TaxID=1990687 RepID=UPI00295358E1|nr:hypothetical protein [Rhodococcus oxybenzonivorans]MDV7357177.1 hypothetical protein [Rhodococcus oxybenzonivorans]